MRKDDLVTGEIYHIFSKSIAGFNIFNDKDEFIRMLGAVCYYQIHRPDLRYSVFLRFGQFENNDRNIATGESKLIEIIAYCIMPTHFHLILKQLKDNGIALYMQNLLNSYTRYFNVKHKRKGPLWEGRYKSVLLKTDEQLLHLTRYIHLNPVTANLVERPEKWEESSYREYLGGSVNNGMCNFNGILEINPALYRKFVEDRIAYQRELQKIKNVTFE